MLIHGDESYGYIDCEIKYCDQGSVTNMSAEEVKKEIDRLLLMLENNRPRIEEAIRRNTQPTDDWGLILDSISKKCSVCGDPNKEGFLAAEGKIFCRPCVEKLPACSFCDQKIPGDSYSSTARDAIACQPCFNERKEKMLAKEVPGGL